MKIIFDSEGQKRVFLYRLSAELCPDAFDYKNKYAEHECRGSDQCEECWDKCGIEFEIKGE